MPQRFRDSSYTGLDAIKLNAEDLAFEQKVVRTQMKIIMNILDGLHVKHRQLIHVYESNPSFLMVCAGMNTLSPSPPTSFYPLSCGRIGCRYEFGDVSKDESGSGDEKAETAI